MASAEEVSVSTKPSKKITSSSTAEYFAKNLQQVGFSSPTKAVLTTLKEAFDNALDACEESGILPDLKVEVEKIGAGSLKNTDKIRIRVQDNGPGIDVDDIPKVFGEYLASSKFGRGRCSRGQQGIGISAATTWAIQTTATGAKVISKTKAQRKAYSCTVEIDLKNNKGVLRDKESLDWDRPHGTSVEFTIDGRIQLNGDAGLLSYIKGNVLVNPHLRLEYKLPESKKETVNRVSTDVPRIPDAADPHPHTMKLGEFISHSRLFGRMKTSHWLKKGFSRLSDNVIIEIAKEAKLSKGILDKFVDGLNDKEFNELFVAIQNAKLMAPSTSSVLSIGEEALAKSIKRIGNIDFFSVVTRKPTICDLKPIQVEVAIARLEEKGIDPEDPVQVLRFANRVPLQFDKAGCAIVKAITTVNWKSYGLRHPKDALPIGPYIVAVSLVSPFIKFKNASKETIDASDELVEEIRRALMMAGQRLSRHIRSEFKANALEEKIRHIEQFGPILVDTLCRLTKSSDERKGKAEEGLMKILGRDAREAKKELSEAQTQLKEHLKKDKKAKARAGEGDEAVVELDEEVEDEESSDRDEDGERKSSKKKASTKDLGLDDVGEFEAETDEKKAAKASKVGKGKKAKK